MADCADAQPDQGLHCLLTDSLDTAKCMNRDQSVRLLLLNALYEHKKGVDPDQTLSGKNKK